MLTFGILFYRWHNVIAARVQRENPSMSDEDIFQRTRRIVVGTIQVLLHYNNKQILNYRVINITIIFQSEYSNVRVFTSFIGQQTACI